MARALVETLLFTLAAFLAALIYYLCVADDPAAGPRRPPRKSQEEPKVAEDREHSLTHQERQRRYLVHLPEGHEPARPLPVVMAFHGALGRAEAMRTMSRLNEVAGRHDFLAVYPDGTGRGAGLTFNAGHCCGYAVEHHVDDVGFVRKLLAELPEHYPVDARRVYATGMSNGAMLCYRLACELSERITAVGAVAGTMGVEGPKPRRPVPVIHFHGEKDAFAPYHGGKGLFGRVMQPAVRETLAWWCEVNGCLSRPTVVQEEGACVCERYELAPGTAGAPVVLYRLPEGGHTWPGGVDLTPHLGMGKLIASVDASSLMWQFFTQFTLPESPEARASG